MDTRPEQAVSRCVKGNHDGASGRDDARVAREEEGEVMGDAVKCGLIVTAKNPQWLYLREVGDMGILKSEGRTPAKACALLTSDEQSEENRRG
jgi:hypothetical protein